MEIFIEGALAALIFLSPLVYGGVNFLALASIESWVFFIFFIYLFYRLKRDKPDFFKAPLLFPAAFIILVLFQLFNLPAFLASFLSPATMALYHRFMPAGHSGPYMLSICPQDTLNLLLQALSYIAIFIVTLNFIDSVKKARRLFLVIVACIFIFSFYGIIRRIALGELAFSTFTNRDHFSAFAQMGAPLAISFALIEQRKARKAMFIFAASVIILAIFLSVSRAGVISFLISIMFMFFALAFRGRIRGPAGLTMIAALSSALFLAAAGAAAMMRRLATLQNPMQAYRDRFILLKDSLAIIKDFPLFGTGLGTYGEIIQKYNTSLKQFSWEFAHNEPVQLLAETGIIGFALISAFAALVFNKIFSSWRKRNSPFAFYITLGGITALLSFMLHSFFDFVFHVPANTVFFCIILALTYKTSLLREGHPESSVDKLTFELGRGKKVICFFIIAAGLISAQNLIIGRVRAELLFEEAGKEGFAPGGIEAVIALKKKARAAEEAIRISPLDSRYYNIEGDLLSRMALAADRQGIGTPETMDKALLSYKTAVLLNPAKADYHLRLGWLYGVMGCLICRQEEFAKAIALDPQNLKIREYIGSQDERF